MCEYLQRLCSYNVWATHKLAEFINGAGETACNKVQVSSFSTIRETLIHILNAQRIWMNRLNGISTVNWPEISTELSANDICQQLVENSNEWLGYTQKLTDIICLDTINYNNLKGAAFHSTIAEIITHVMNHGTFHRGQLITMLRTAGFDELESTDMITWCRLQQ